MYQYPDTVPVSAFGEVTAAFQSEWNHAELAPGDVLACDLFGELYARRRVDVELNSRVELNERYALDEEKKEMSIYRDSWIYVGTYSTSHYDDEFVSNVRWEGRPAEFSGQVPFAEALGLEAGDAESALMTFQELESLFQERIQPLKKALEALDALSDSNLYPEFMARLQNAARRHNR